MLAIILNVLQAQALGRQHRPNDAAHPHLGLWAMAAAASSAAASTIRAGVGGEGRQHRLGRREAHADHEQRAGDDADHPVKETVAFDDDVIRNLRLAGAAHKLAAAGLDDAPVDGACCAPLVAATRLEGGKVVRAAAKRARREGGEGGKESQPST